MSARRLDLLEKLCTLLEGLPPEKFDYSTWANGADLHACETTACALGWATAIPECELRLSGYGNGRYVKHATGSTDERAAMAAFGISEEQAGALFYALQSSPDLDDEQGPRTTASATEVAAWIRRQIEAWRADGAA